jgi:hypothetical protein
LKQLDAFIGDLELKQVHMGSLQKSIAQRRQDGVKTKTLNLALAARRDCSRLRRSSSASLRTAAAPCAAASNLAERRPSCRTPDLLVRSSERPKSWKFRSLQAVDS